MTALTKFGRRAFLSAAALGVAALSLTGSVLAQDVTKIAAVWTVPVEQQWASRLHLALIAAQERGEIEYVYSENVSNTDYERVMREYSEQGAKLVIGEAFGVEQPARAVAEEYPEVMYLMGSSLQPVEPNFATFDNFIQEPSYLTGMVAGMKTETNKIGMIGGYAIPEVNRLMNAFMQGALSVNPEVKFSVSFINSWYDPPKAKESAFAMIDAGADILYAERFGVSDAAKERGVLAIGNVIDTAADYPGTILASALWHGEPMINKAIADIKAGSFTASDYGIYAFLEHGGSSAVYDEALAGAEAVAAAKAKEAEILAGTFKVDINDAEPSSSM
ncbi:MULTISPECIES: BMP family protein [unclassified Devosia]|uniref:BMP family protein n=1 Tax=unclassified Devosia TaxID=196773 RepID=UPI00145DB467|nr:MULTISPECIES: BMP family protein [unclassified Devosia]MBJ6986326.1 BMP family protein [Devosia sp. MC521]QMW64195.1 BMP family protein [Devosia sp. MC521]